MPPGRSSLSGSRESAFPSSSAPPPIPAAVAHQSLSRSSASEHERLVANVRALDLNIEFHETIKQ
jgi:hypothetical protein